MKKAGKITGYIAILCLLVGVTTSNAQDKETRQVNDFTKISVSSGIDLYLTQANEINLEIEADKDLLHKIVTEVQNGTLKIYSRDRFNWGMEKSPKVYLSYKNIEEINCGGGSDVFSKNTIHGETLTVISSGGSDAYLEVNVTDLKLSSSGGSDLKVKGTAKNLVAEASGGSDIIANDLKAQFVKVSSSGGADASVNAEKEIIANASGGSDIWYYGNPEKKELNESGGGDITQK